MKKLGKKISFLTKIMLVVGLLISNLSSLSVVFAYEVPDDVVINLNNDKLEVSYNEELAEEVEAVKVKVYESYTYLDGESITPVVNDFLLDEEQLLAAAEGTLEFVYETIFASLNDEDYKLFDGTYSAKVEIVDVTDYTEDIEDEIVETVISYGTYEKEITHESGLSLKLYDSTDTEIVLVNDKYQVYSGNSNIKVVGKILAGGLVPTDIYKYDDTEYFASELVRMDIDVKTLDFSGHLYGEYEELVDVKVLKEMPVTSEVSPEEAGYEEIVYTDTINVMYESYPLNAEVLNDVVSALELGDKYLFYNEEKDGILHVFSGLTEDAELATVLDLYNVLNEAVNPMGGEQLINYTIVKNGINLIESFEPVSEGETIEDYLDAIVLDDTVLVTLTCKDLSVSYNVVVFGDLNNDNLITEDDLLELINQYVGEKEVENIDKSDIFGDDGEINSLDIIYLNQVIRNKSWNVPVTEEEVELDALLKANLGEKENLVSGDEFTVDFVLSLSDYDVSGILGNFTYDKELFELLSVKVNEEWAGNSKDGKFAYVGEESIKASEIEESEENTEEQDSLVAVITEEDEINATDYVLITATFRALKATGEESNNTITLDEIELFNADDQIATYYTLDINSVTSEEINVVASADNTLKYLEVAGTIIELVDGVYEYEITVPNDITNVDLKYILNNIAASVSGEVYPEELTEGSNIVTITVVAENGDVQEYKVTVIREEAEEEETTQVTYDYTYENDYPEREEVVTTPAEPEEPVVEDEEESNLSRIVIIILILIVIAGLVYLIFKDEDDDETKKANKAVNKLKKEAIAPEIREIKKEEPKKEVKEKKVSTEVKKDTKKSTAKNSNTSKNKSSKSNTNNKKKER